MNRRTASRHRRHPKLYKTKLRAEEAALTLILWLVWLVFLRR
jgi:hypothetical protein